jgi:hypothetical protein
MKNKIILISTLLAGLFIFNSCLKDDADYWKDDVAGKMYATVFSPGFHTNSVQPIPDVVTFSFMVNIATDKLPTTDITLNLAFDDAAISAYDSTLLAKAKIAKDTNDDGTWKWKNYKPFPSRALITPVVVIPAGTRTGTAQFTVDRADSIVLTSYLQKHGGYMVAVSITSVSPATVKLTANMSTYLLALPLANKYEGLYAGDGFFKHPTAASSRALTADKTLTTETSDKCKTGLADLADPATGQYYIYITVGATATSPGIYPVTIDNVNPAAPLVLAQLNNADDLITFDNPVAFNYYDENAKMFVLRYHYNNGAAWREIEEILTKK